MPAKDMPFAPFETWSSKGHGEALEELILTLTPSVEKPRTDRTVDLLRSYVLAFPKLRRIEIPDVHVPLDDEEAMNAFEDVEEMMVQRSDKNEKDFVGILLETD